MLNLSNTSLQTNDTKLMFIKRQCDHSHKHCYEIIQFANKFTHLITEDYFNDFIRLVANTQYSSCLSFHHNTKYLEIKKFIMSNSKIIKINKFDLLIIFLSDAEIYELILNQLALDPELINKLINLEINQNYGPKTNFLNLLITGQLKLKTFEHIIIS